MVGELLDRPLHGNLSSEVSAWIEVTFGVCGPTSFTWGIWPRALYQAEPEN